MREPPVASLTHETAAQWAGQLLSRYSLRLEGIKWIPGYGGSAAVSDDGVILTLGEQVLQDAATMRFHVAHEVGHVVLGHATGLRRRRLRLTVISVAVTLVLEGGVMAAAVLWSWPIVLVPVVLLAAMGALSRCAVLPLERAADEFAAAHGAPASSASIPPTPWLNRWVLKTHPTQQERSRPIAPMLSSHPM